MFKKQSFFKKVSDVKSESKCEDVNFKFDELPIETVLEDSMGHRKLDGHFKIPANAIKDRQQEFAKNIFIRGQEITIPKVAVNQNPDIKFDPNKQQISFPEKYQSQKTNLSKEVSKVFSKYVRPSNIINLFNWSKYSTDRPHLDIEELIKSHANKSDIKKLVPNKFCLGTDIVPSYLLKRTKKCRANTKTNGRPENMSNHIIKAHKAHGSFTNNELHITFLGSAKCGKSTLIGNILLHLDVFDSAFIKKTEWESTKMNCPQLKTAWLTDTSTDERSFRETISMSSHYAEIADKSVNLIDSPGNLCYYEQLIKSIIRADGVMLLIDLGTDWCESSDEFKHIDYLFTVFYLLKVFSVDQLEIVFVNLLNRNIESPLRKLTSMWKRFSSSRAHHITIDDLSAIRPSELELLIDRIGRIPAKPSPSELDKPLLVEIVDIYKPVESAVPVVLGRVLRGGVSSGVNNRSSKAVILPENLACTVKSLRIHEKKELKTRSFAFPGNLVEFTLPEIDADDQIKLGSFICNPYGRLSIGNHFKVEMMIFDSNIDILIANGMKVLLWSKCRSCFCDVTTFLSVEYFKGKEKITKKFPRSISRSGSTAMAQIRTDDLLAVEFQSAHKLDVFLLFYGLKLFAAGKFVDIIK